MLERHAENESGANAELKLSHVKAANLDILQQSKGQRREEKKKKKVEKHSSAHNFTSFFALKRLRFHSHTASPNRAIFALSIH